MTGATQSDLLLAKAIRAGELNNLLWMLTDGANPNGVTDKTGEPLLLLAARTNNTEILRAMVEAGADVNAPSPTGETPLMAAVRLGQQANIDYLIAKGANAAAKDGSGKSAAAIGQELRDQNYLSVMSNALNGVLTPNEKLMVDKWEQITDTLYQAERDAMSVVMKTNVAVGKPLKLKRPKA